MREQEGGVFQMAMTKCSECSGSLSSKAASCPHCGAKPRRTSGCAWFALCVFAFIGFIFFLGVSSDSPSRSSSSDDDSSDDELKGQVGFVINARGYPCARVVSITPLEVRPDVYEVECIEYRGGKGKKTYMLDAINNQVWIP